MVSRHSRKRWIEAAIVVAVLAVAVTLMVPRFLRGQNTVSVLRPLETSLESWERVYGTWDENGGVLTPRGDAALPVRDFLLVHQKRFEAEPIQTPITFGFDVRFGIPPEDANELWIGFGIGSVRRGIPDGERLDAGGVRPFNTAALHALVLMEDGAFQQRLYTDVGWMGETRPSRESTDTPLTLVKPDQWHHVEWEFTALDWNSGGVESRGRFWEKGTRRGLALFSEPVSYTFSSPYTECFNPPCSQLILYVRQTGPMLPIDIKNISVRAQRRHPD